MLIRNIKNYIIHKRVIKKIIKEENLLQNLSKLFTVNDYTVNFKQDWVGRIYAVVNPIAQDPNSRIFEYDEHGMNVKSFVEKWLIEHMIAADNFVKNHELFDILTYDIQQLDEDYNFLFTLTPIAWIDFWKSMKIFLGISIPILIALIVCLIIFL